MNMIIKTFQFNPFQENTYLVYDEMGEAAVIDAGAMQANEQALLEQYIQENGLQLKYVLNTHLHLDHQFGNKALFDAFGVAPLAHKDDEFMLPQMAAHCSAFGLQMSQDDVQSLGGYVEDGQMIRLGNMDIRVIATPGHSPGGVCYYVESEGVVFTGDTLFQQSIGRTDLPGGDYGTLIASIREKLLVLPDETATCCGHGGSSTIGSEKRYNGFLQ